MLKRQVKNGFMKGKSLNKDSLFLVIVLVYGSIFINMKY